MQPVAIYAAVIEDLDTKISKSTIKNELRRRLKVTPTELWQTGVSAYALIPPKPDRARSTPSSVTS
jgi:hypothetical protein